MRVAESLEVSAPPEVVWKVISDPTRYLHFLSGFTRWEVVSDEPGGCGARYKMLMRVGSAEIGGLIEVVEWVPNREIAWTSITGIDQRGRWILRDCHPETEATLRVSYQVPGVVLALVSSQFGRPLLRRDLRRSLEALREAVRHGPIDEAAAA